jgi:hypothetical protein
MVVERLTERLCIPDCLLCIGLPEFKHFHERDRETRYVMQVVVADGSRKYSVIDRVG